MNVLYLYEIIILKFIVILNENDIIFCLNMKRSLKSCVFRGIYLIILHCQCFNFKHNIKKGKIFSFPLLKFYRNSILSLLFNESEILTKGSLTSSESISPSLLRQYFIGAGLGSSNSIGISFESCFHISRAAL